MAIGLSIAIYGDDRAGVHQFREPLYSDRYQNPGVQIASEPAPVGKRLLFSDLDSGICGGSQPTLSAALATCGVKRH